MTSHTHFANVLLFLVILHLPPVALAAESKTLYEQAAEAYVAHDYQRSGELFRAAAEQDEAMAAFRYYDAACSFARTGKADEAFLALERSIGAGYQDAWKAAKDKDLASLHGDPRWQAFLDRAATNAKAGFEFWNNPAMHSGFKENLSDDEKIAGLSKLWAEAKFNFVYFDRVPALNWDSVYMEYLPKVRATKSTLEYYRVLMSMYARLGDGHTDVRLPDELWDKGYARPLLRTIMVEGKVIVVKVAEHLATAGLTPGLEIMEIDGLPVQKYAQRHVAPYQSASTPQERDARVYGWALLEGPIGTSVELTLRDAAAHIAKRSLPRVSAKEWFQRFQQEPMDFKMLPRNVAYVALNSFENSKAADLFEARFPEIAHADALVIDVRENGGGNSRIGDRVLACLTDKWFDGLKWATRDYKPALRAMGLRESRFTRPSRKVAPNGKLHYAKPVVLLTSPRTYSAAEDFTAKFRGMKRGKIVGEVTGGSSGNPIFFPLPGGGSARVCALQAISPDGTEFMGIGIKPDVVVRPTVADIHAGRDTVLEAALQVLEDELGSADRESSY